MSISYLSTAAHQSSKHHSMERTTNKIRGLFRKKTDEESAGRPAVHNKHESPKPHFSPGHAAQDKGTRKGKDRRSGKGMWRPKKRKGEWESISGRHLTLQEVSVNDLCLLEIEYLQREAVTRLQKMDVAVSHGILKGFSARGVFQRLSSNSQARRRISDKEMQHAVFGQPLEALAGNAIPAPAPVLHTMHSATSSPALTYLDQQCHTPSPSSPTRTSDTSTEEFNATPSNTSSASLDVFSVVSPPSPRTLRRQALTPPEQQVPMIVRKAIEHLDTKGVKVEGLFRIPGSKARIAELRERIDAGLDVELTEDTNPHDVACLLKEFFRSLPEPLLTKELYYPFLSTTKFENPGRRRDALRLLCVLLPQPNRDTLKELLQFLSRVALHSYGMILIDGTEESGNRMTEQNLATVLGPNLLHKESKRKPPPKSGGDQYQVLKQDPEELSNVAKVIEDLIRMHKNVFTIPPELQDPVLRQILLVDPDAIDQILKKRCIDQGLQLPPPEDAGVEQSKAPLVPSETSLTTFSAVHSESAHDRNDSLSDSQRTLEEALETLNQYINDELSPAKTLSNVNSTQSPLASSKSPLVTTESSSTMVDSPSSSIMTVEEGARKSCSPLVLSKELYASADSAFSNNSSSHSSTEAVSDTVSCSEVNTLSCNLECGDKGFMDNVGYAATPPLKGSGGLVATHSMPTLMLDSISRNTFEATSGEKGRTRKANSKWRHQNKMGELYEIQRSPILSSKEQRQFYDVLCGIPSGHTPTNTAFSVPASAPISEDGTVM